MKFIHFINKYYDVTQRNYSESRSFEEMKTLEKNIFERKKGEGVSLLRSERQKQIKYTYLIFTIIIGVLLFLSLINIKFLYGLIPITIFLFLYTWIIDCNLFIIFITYLLYNDCNNVFKSILKENFDSNNLTNKINKEYILVDNSNPYSLRKLKCSIIGNDCYIIKIIFKRNNIKLKAESKTLIIDDKNLKKEDVFKLINCFIETIHNKAINNYEWSYLCEVKFKEKFSVYGKKISLNKCICDNKEVGINCKNNYNIKKAIRYRFNIEYKKYYILAYKLDEFNYVVFEKKVI